MSGKAYNDLSREVIGCAIEVHKELGPGLLERVYEDALEYEMMKKGLEVDRQVPIDVCYEELDISNVELQQKSRQ